MDNLKYKLIIFDLDGTVLDTLRDLYTSVNHALEKHGLPLREMEEVRAFVGNGVHKLIERSVPQNTDPEIVEAVYGVFCEYYNEHSADNTRPYDGVLELMNTIKNSGGLLAVVSNKPDAAVKTLCDAYFSDLLECAIGERRGIARKPAPDSVLEVLADLNIQKEAAVYIGDSEVDIQTAQNAGLDCISVSWGFKDRDFLQRHGACAVAVKPQDLQNLLYVT